MKLDFSKIELAKASAAMGTAEMLAAAGVPLGTWNGILRTRNTSAKTVGKLAKALGVNVTDIVIMEDEK